MKRLVNTPLKILGLVTIAFGLASILLAGFYLLFFGLVVMGVGLLLYLVDALFSKLIPTLPKRFWLFESILSFAYLLTWFLLIMKWGEHNEIVFPNHFKGDAAIIFGIEGYPPLPKTHFWKKKIYLPNDGIFITSSKKEEAFATYRFKSQNGEAINSQEFSIAGSTDYPCFLHDKEIIYFNYRLGADGNGKVQRKLAELCNEINNGTIKTKYTSTDYRIVWNTETSYLNLMNKGLMVLPDAISTFPVKKLILTGNDFTTIPPPVQQMRGLEELLLGYNPITDVPKEIYQLKNLKRLSLNDTKVRQITTDLSPLMKLEDLDLSGNEFDRLPEQVKRLPNLKELEVENNRLKDLSFIDNRLGKLEVLYVYSNRIKRLSEQTKYLRNLKDLLIFDNQIDSIGDNISDLQGLEHLEIWNNPIIYVSPKIGGLQKLKSLRIDDDSLPEEAKDNLRKWLPNCRINFQTRGN